MTDDILAKAKAIVGDQTQHQYGSPAVNFGRIAQGWEVIFDDGHFTEERIALAMVWLKICRQLQQHKQDNLIDAIGYLLTIDMMQQEQDRIKTMLNTIDVKTIRIPGERWADNV